MTTSIAAVATAADWMYLIDSCGRVWERPMPASGLDPKWERLPPLPHGYKAEAFAVTADGAVHVVAKDGTKLYRYLAEQWEVELLPDFDAADADAVGTPQ